MKPVFLHPSMAGESLQPIPKGLPGAPLAECPWKDAGDCDTGSPAAVPLVIFIAQDRLALRQLVSLKEFLWRIKIILVLPDDEEETIALAHRLKPRYLCYLEDDCSELGQVVNKMLGHCL
jgi:hypothetical protein